MDKETIIKFMQENFETYITQREWNKFPNHPCGKSKVQKLFGTWNNALEEAGLLSHAHPNGNKLNNCPVCGKFTSTKYCSLSCANKDHPKRKRTTTCVDCGVLITRQRTRCLSCYDKTRMILGNKTKGEIAKNKENGANKYSQINGHARTLFRARDSKCSLCNYSKHVEVCHIRPVRSFSDETLISEINSPENIILLCPNCHWEFDHGLLDSDLRSASMQTLVQRGRLELPTYPL